VKPQRIAKIDHEIQRILGTLISQELQDPRLAFVTVTRAEVSEDLRHCKVFVSVIGDRHQARQSLDALQHASRFLRGDCFERLVFRRLVWSFVAWRQPWSFGARLRTQVVC